MATATCCAARRTLGYRSGFNIDEELRAAFDVVTEAGAKALRLEGYGLRVGAKADFVTLNAEHVPEAVVAVPQGRSVYKEGMLVASNGTIVGKHSAPDQFRPIYR